MTPADFKARRRALGLSLFQIAQAIGYGGDRDNQMTTIRKFESGARPIPPWIERLIVMYSRHGIPDEYKPSDRISD